MIAGDATIEENLPGCKSEVLKLGDDVLAASYPSRRTRHLARVGASLKARRLDAPFDHAALAVVELQLGHTKIESTVRYLGVEVDDALAIAEQIGV